MTRRRLDAELVRRGLVTSRSEAREAVDAGLVTVGGRPATKPAALVGLDEPLVLRGAARRLVSRGGIKLEAALERFGVDVRGALCLDAGASTGGFSDALLRAGARHVVAIDVGYGQLDWGLRNDERMTVYERTNVRHLTVDLLPYAAEVVVADLSFISLTLVAENLVRLADAAATFVVLVKPQFEAGVGGVGRGGVVRDPETWRVAVRAVADAFAANGATPLGVMASPLRGPAGNVEFLLHARSSTPDRLPDDHLDVAIDAAIAEGKVLVR